MVAKTKTYVDWKNRPFAKDANAEQKRQQAEKWSALAEWIRKRGGFVTSLPGIKTLKIECPKNSELPAKLTELGYIVAERGFISRVVGATNYATRLDEITNGAPSPFVTYSVFEITLGGK